jgi:PAS domain S-box-containing protein
MLFVGRSSSQAVRACHVVARVSAHAILALGAVVICGWLLGVAHLKGAWDSWPSVKPNTALAFVLAGFALALLTHAEGRAVSPTRTRLAQWCATAVALIGGLTLVEHLFGLYPGIDHFLFRELPGAPATPYPGRMSPVGAMGFLALGGALLGMTSRRFWATLMAQAFCVVSAVAAFVALAGYLYEGRALQQASLFTSIAMPTAAGLLLLSLGIACLKPTTGLMALFTADTAGGQVLRRLLLPVVLMPVVLNWLELLGERHGGFPPNFGWMLDAGLTVVLVGSVVWGVCRVVHRKDVERLAAEERYRLLVESSPDGIVVKDRRRIEFANTTAARLLGAHHVEQLVGKSPLAFVAPEVRARFEPELCRLLEQGGRLPLMEQRLQRLDGTPLDAEIAASCVEFGGRRMAQLVVRDVTERKRAEQARRESEERFRLIAETITEVFWMADAKLERIIYVSPAYEHVWGRSCASLYQNPRSFLDAIHPEDRPAVEADLDRKSAVQVLNQEYRIVRPDGSVRWIWDRAFPVRNESGEVLHCVGVAVDITERKRLELMNTALLTLARRLNSVSTTEEAARAVVEVADELLGWDACLVGWYDSQANIWQPILRMDTIRGAKVRVPWGNPGPPGTLMHRVVSEGARLLLRDQPDQAVAELSPFGDEARRSASLMFVPMRVEGRVVGIVSIQSYTPRAYTEEDLKTLQALADHCGSVIARTRVQEALQASEERFRATFEQAAVGVAHVSPEGRYLRVNEKLCQITGYTREELLARTFQEITHPDDLPVALDQMRRLLAGEIRTFSQEKRCLCKAGSVVWVESTASLVRKPGGEPDYFIFVIEDITQRRLLEAQLRQSQKLEAIGQLAGGVAHDFNNILAVILLQAELAMADEHLPGDARAALAEIRKAAEKAASLTRQLLMFSRKQVMQPRSLDLNEVVTGLAKMLRRVVQENIQLQLHLAPGPVFVHADPGMLDQVLLNLAVNARDAMPEGGQLIIETGERPVEAAEAEQQGAAPGRYAWLRVSDTGAGIPPEILPRIFEPFFTTKEPGKGTGLGLATVFGVVKQHRGWVTVQSEVGRGTTFQIFLPAIEAPTSAAVDEAHRPVLPGGAETILLVEDDPSVRLMTRLTLERHGYAVLEAADGLEALRLAEQNRGIALILTDLVLPGGIGGRELAQQLRVALPRAKVVFMSGYSPEIAGRELKLEFGQNFIAKPCTPRQLLEAIRSCLDA